MATKKPMKKFKRFDEGGPVDEATAKQSGLDMSSKEKPMGFFERLRAGNIDDPSSEAYKRFGAGRGRATAETATESKPQIVARIPPKPREPTPNEESGKLQNMISSGSDIVGRPQDEGYRPNAGTESERAMLEGAFDSDKIIENIGPRTKPIVKTPSKSVASKPKAPTPKVTDTGDQGERLLARYKKPALRQETMNERAKRFIEKREAAKREKEANPARGRGGVAYAKGGSVSSASKRADGIATKGKTRGRMC
jgi:hypothetical protein